MKVFWAKLIEDEGGQATVEYTLLLGIIAGMLVLVVKKMIQPVFQRLSSALSDNIEKRVFGSNLHHFNVRR